MLHIVVLVYVENSKKFNLLNLFYFAPLIISFILYSLIICYCTVTVLTQVFVRDVKADSKKDSDSWQNEYEARKRARLQGKS